MQTRFRLRRSSDFARLRERGRTWRHPFLILSVIENNLEHNRYGLIVSKRLGNAVKRNRVRRLMREGWISLGIGLGFISIALGIRELIDAFARGMFAEVVAEGLLVTSWVAMWKPVQIFLYGWWPLRNRIRNYERLADITVEVKPESDPPIESLFRTLQKLF